MNFSMIFYLNCQFQSNKSDGSLLFRNGNDRVSGMHAVLGRSTAPI